MARAQSVETGAARARPFLKWAGGKSQLIRQFESLLPPALKAGRIKRYVEPFVGGGAVFFHVAQAYPVGEFILYDSNEELVLAYQVVRNDVGELVRILSSMGKTYLKLSSEKRKKRFYEVRGAFNAEKPSIAFDEYSRDWARRAAQMIFLNRTCFNGLFRVNASGAFNVPCGRYANPKICDAQALGAAAALLRRAEVRRADFSEAAGHADSRTFIYYDPPYRPLSRTANFTAYGSGGFSDLEQIRLAAVFRRAHERGALQMLSNSDPRNVDPDDDFFDRLYSGFDVRRVSASRMINSNTARRGRITEVLIRNYREASLNRE